MTSLPPPRINSPRRDQVELRVFDLDSTVPEGHAARVIWAAVESLDLAPFYDDIEARGETAGRSATDPKLLLALWLYAHTEGVGAGRAIARLCGRDDVYRWICGGVSVNYHTLNDFRSQNVAGVDRLLTQVLGRLTFKGLVTLERVSQDGMRVRADAGAASFRSKASLEEHVRAAGKHVAKLREELDEDPTAAERIRQAAQRRAAEDRKRRVAAAMAEMPKVEAVCQRRKPKQKEGQKKPSEPRVSTTDPEARVMRMPDGGYRPAYNVQLAADVETGVVVGVRVSNVGSDAGQMLPMLDEIQQRTGLQPGEHLVDGGYMNLAAITEATRRGVTVYCPTMKGRAKVRWHCHRDTAEVAQWRRRMERTDSKAIYKDRASTSERLNADLKRHRSLDRIPVRGLRKALGHVLLACLAHNVLRWHALDPALAA